MKPMNIMNILHESNGDYNLAAVDFVNDKIQDELGVNWRNLPEDEVKDAVRRLTNEYNNANIEPEYENEDFYGNEADYNEVYKIIRNKINESTWCGVPNTTYRYHGEWSNPEVEYEGKLYNEYDLQEYIGDIFNDYCKENNIEVNDNNWHEEFSKWLEKNPDYAYSAFENLEPNDNLTEGSNTSKYNYIDGADYEKHGYNGIYNSEANTEVHDILEELKGYFDESIVYANDLIKNASMDTGISNEDIEMLKFCSEKTQEMLNKMDSTWD